MNLLKLDKNKLVFIFLDFFQKKNKLQHDILIKNGYSPIWLQANSEYGVSNESMCVMPSSFFKRLKFVFKLLNQNKKRIHHIEIYPGGRFAFIYLILAKMLSLKILCVERGDLYYLANKKYDRFTRFSSTIIYHFSNYIWTRELYADDELKKLKVKTPQHFIHNVVKLPDYTPTPSSEKTIDFLWVNTLKDFRRFDWFVAAMKDTYFEKTKSLVLGVSFTKEADKIYFQSALTKEVPTWVELKEFSNPIDYYKKAKFFVLPTSLVYLNNALLEAMSYGVVPIITQAQGADKIIENEKDGFISEYTQDSYHATLKKALDMPEDKYNEMSHMAIEKVKKEFADTYYETELMILYNKL